MTPPELAAARRELGLNKTELANRLKTPYRTYVDWERGVSPISGAAEVAIELLLERDRRFMAAITGRDNEQRPCGTGV